MPKQISHKKTTSKKYETHSWISKQYFVCNSLMLDQKRRNYGDPQQVIRFFPRTLIAHFPLL